MEASELWAEVRRVWALDHEDSGAAQALLVLLWLYLAAAPVDEDGDFEDFDKDLFDAKAGSYQDAFESERAPDILLPAFEDFAAAAAGLDRALADPFMSLTGNWIGYTVSSVSVPTVGGEAKEYWLSKRRKALDFQVVSVDHRALPHAVIWHHRVIPKVTDKKFSFEVTEFPKEHRKRVFRGDEMHIAALVFDDAVELDVAFTGKFAVLGYKQGAAGARARGRAADALITSALASPEISAILMPEMCLSKKLESAVLKRLRRQLSECGDRVVLALPGSFHEKENGRTVNAATLWLVGGDFDSVPLLRHRKFARAKINKMFEDIRPATRIELLATPWGLWAIAICMDFCSDIKVVEHVWRHLDVDVVLVPSYGDATTLKLHLQRASKMYARQRAQVVVAQQMLEPAPPNRGVVVSRTFPNGLNQADPPDGGLQKVTISF